MCFLQKSGINVTEPPATGADLFLHAHQLREVQPGLFRAQAIAPFFDTVAGEANTFYTNYGHGRQHIAHRFFDAFYDAFFNLLVGYNRTCFWVVNLSLWR